MTGAGVATAVGGRVGAVPDDGEKLHAVSGGSDSSSVSTFSVLPPVPPPENGAGVHQDHSVQFTHCSAQKLPVACQRRIICMRAPCQVLITPPFLTFPSGVTAS